MRPGAWIGCDFDGTLVEWPIPGMNRDDWDPERIGRSIPLMVARVRVWLAAGWDVRIMTARANPKVVSTPESAVRGVKAVQAWSLATFHTVSFVAAVVVGLHARGSLTAALGRLDTALGVAAFVGLWALTWTATRAGLRALELDEDDRGSISIVMRLTVAGGWNGIGIFGALVFVLLFNLASRGTPALMFVPVLFLGVAIGVSLAFTIGALVGFVYGLVDAALLRGADVLFRWTQGVQS